MLRYIALFFLLPIMVVPAFAQSGVSYQSETIYLQGNSFVKNGTRYPSGFFGRRLMQEMEVSPDAVVEFRKYRTKRVIVDVMSLASLGFLVAARTSDDLDTRDSMYAAFLATTIVSIPIRGTAYNNLHKAVWIRNGM